LRYLTQDGLLQSDLWIDQPDAMQTVDIKALSHGVDGQQLDAAKNVILKGYGILDLRLDPEVYKAIDNEVDAIWRERPADVAWGGSIAGVSGDFAISDIPPDYSRTSPQIYRFCCAHSHSPAMESIYYNRELHETVSFLFGEPCIATQTLYFEYGSQQGQHRDTSVVSFDPLSNLLAAWVALEDVEEGAGALEYIPGSHRIENFQYPDGSIIWRPEYGLNSIADMDAGIRSTAQRHKLPTERFLAKRGQALIWHHSLSHGGSLVKKPGRTRKSLVIHFTTKTAFKSRDHSLIFRPKDSKNYWSFESATTEIIERDGCYGAASAILGWHKGPRPPAKRLSGKYEYDKVVNFAGKVDSIFPDSRQPQGYVDALLMRDNATVISGWAIDGNLEPAPHVVLVNKGVVIDSWPTGTRRDDLAQVFSGVNSAYGGFYHVIPSNKLAGVADARFFAVDDEGGFAELKLAPAVTSAALFAEREDLRAALPAS
jgi:ectoine hydroxylase-related dioxygenase (phytanoyl-CoA dioxygenase family)